MRLLHRQPEQRREQIVPSDTPGGEIGTHEASANTVCMRVRCKATVSQWPGCAHLGGLAALLLQGTGSGRRRGLRDSRACQRHQREHRERLVGGRWAAHEAPTKRTSSAVADIAAQPEPSRSHTRQEGEGQPAVTEAATAARRIRAVAARYVGRVRVRTPCDAKRLLAGLGWPAEPYRKE